MPIIRTTHTENYTVISNAYTKCKLSLKARGLYCAIMALPDNWKFSIPGLARLVGEGESAIRNTLKELATAGFMRKECILPSKSCSTITYRYTFYELPFGVQDPAADKSAAPQDADFQDIDPLGIDSLDADPLDVDSLDADSLGADSLDADSLGADSLYADSLDAEPLDAEPLDADSQEPENRPVLNTNRQNTKRQNTDLLSTDRQSTDDVGRAQKREICETIIENFNCICTDLPSVRLTDGRFEKLLRLLSVYSEDDIEEAFRTAQCSDFLTARDGGSWQASFDWLVIPSNMGKVLAGRYRNYSQPRRAARDPYADPSYYSSEYDCGWQQTYPSGRFPPTSSIEEIEAMFAEEERRLFSQIDDTSEDNA